MDEHPNDDYKFIKVNKIENGEFEIFFSDEHNKVKQQLFYQDKIDYNNLIHSVEERENLNYTGNKIDSATNEIINIFGTRMKKQFEILSFSFSSYCVGDFLIG